MKDCKINISGCKDTVKRYIELILKDAGCHMKKFTLLINYEDYIVDVNYLIIFDDFVYSHFTESSYYSKDLPELSVSDILNMHNKTSGLHKMKNRKSFKIDVSNCSLSQREKIQIHILNKLGNKWNSGHTTPKHLNEASYLLVDMGVLYKERCPGRYFKISKLKEIIAETLLTYLDDDELDEKTVGEFPANALKYLPHA